MAELSTTKNPFLAVCLCFLIVACEACVRDSNCQALIGSRPPECCRGACNYELCLAKCKGDLQCDAGDVCCPDGNCKSSCDGLDLETVLVILVMILFVAIVVLFCAYKYRCCCFGRRARGSHREVLVQPPSSESLRVRVTRWPFSSTPVPGTSLSSDSSSPPPSNGQTNAHMDALSPYN